MTDADAAVLSKLDAAELRFGLAEDDKLGKLLDLALINILGFLASESSAVKTKTMGILSHLSKRIKGNDAVPLPLARLVSLFTNPGTIPLVANFALIFVEMGLPRVAPAERAGLVASLLVGLARRPTAQQDTLLSLLLTVLPSLPLPTTKEDLGGVPPQAPPSLSGGGGGVTATADAMAVDSPPRAAKPATLPFLVPSDDRAIVLAWLLDLLLFLPPLASAPHVPPPGLSRAAAKRVCGKLADSEVRGELLAAKKMAALRLLGAMTKDGAAVFTPSETLPHWVVGSCDNDAQVCSLSDSTLRKLQAAE